MAKQIILVCDIHSDTHPATQVLKLRFNSFVSEVDVCDVAAKELREDWFPVMRKGRHRDTNKKAPKGTQPAKIDPAQNKDMREWAEKKGIPYNKRGRLTQSTIDAYQAFHQR